MRVMYLHYIYQTAGPLVQVNEFARAFRALGHELSLHAMDMASQPFMRLKIRGSLKRRVSWCLHEANTLRKNVSYYRRESRLVQMERPDVLLTHYKLYHGSSAFVARRFRIPFVLWVDAPASYEQRTYLREFVQVPGLAERIERLMVAMANRVIVVSEEAKRYLPLDGLRSRHIEVVPNGVDPEQFRPALDGGVIRAQFPVADPVVLGFVGSFAPWHGVESLKALLAFALSAYDNTCCLFVGDGPRRVELEALSRSGRWNPRRVCFTGHVDHAQVPAYIAAMDACLLPYDDQGSEGFYFSPLKLFEYLACGKAVLASGVGQVAQVIQDGLNGMLCAGGNPSEAIAKLKQLIESPWLRQQLGEAGRRTVLERYTWHHAARAVEQILQRTVEARGNP